MYEELIANLRFIGTDYHNAAADAIEELAEKCQSSEENNIRLIGHYVKLKNRVSQLNDHQHYSGAYIKVIMGVSDEADK